MTNIFIFRLNKIATKNELIEQVLELFEQMMKPECTNTIAETIANERKKLESNREYFQSWCLTLPDWCPDVAIYATQKENIKIKFDYFS